MSHLRALPRLSVPLAVLALLSACTALPPASPGSTSAPAATSSPAPRSVPGGSTAAHATAEPGAPIDLSAPPPDGVLLPPLQPTLPAPPSTKPAVVALLDSAHAEARAGRLPSATASLERALRIEPRNAVLWQELAQLALQKGDYAQAESFAARSTAWAAGNRTLIAKNWLLIAQARSLRGDAPGAKAAQARAKTFE